MRILITGNTGYVGPAVIRHLREALPDAILEGYDTGYFAHSLTGVETAADIFLSRQLFGDIRDIDASVLAGVDAVIHLAAISNDPMGNKFEEVTDAINHKASIRLAQLAKENGVRNFVFASSCSVYGAAGDQARREQDPLNPLTAYARSKVATEDALRAMNRGAMTVTCLRFATACGMSDRLRLDLVLNDFVAGALAGGAVTVLSDGSPWRPLIDVRDMARAIEWAATREEDNGGNFLAVNAGSDAWNYQVRDLAHAVARAVPGTKVSINTAAQADKRSYRVDFALFTSLAPAHTPKVSLDESIAALKSGLTRMAFADREFRASPYMRLKILENHIASGRLSADLRWQAGAA